MRKSILMMLLAVASSGAMAEWVEVGGNDEQTTYTDLATISKNGNRAKMWHLISYKMTKELRVPLGQPAGKLFISIKEQTEFDCKEKQSRTTYVSYHSENMGGGESVYYSSKPTEWHQVPPETGFEILWEFACGKK